MSQQAETYKGDGQIEGVSRGTWMGRPIEELSREELMDALIILGEQYIQADKQHVTDLEFLRSLRG